MIFRCSSNSILPVKVKTKKDLDYNARTVHNNNDSGPMIESFKGQNI